MVDFRLHAPEQDRGRVDRGLRLPRDASKPDLWRRRRPDDFGTRELLEHSPDEGAAIPDGLNRDLDLPVTLDAVQRFLNQAIGTG